ncbi:anthocyanidin 3-O-glucosyltransferase 2-like [Rutidosis leptorrhynchoides]|uniref:anthocyanidin 3-O-glucosyltransferase 2-like n=1 Tax=Rutidosis leptorrhynchoides TaxID=125765 RepID=UPI003A9A2103
MMAKNPPRNEVSNSMEKELIFIPAPFIGHVGQSVELAMLLVNRFDHLTITVLTMKLPGDSFGTNYTNSLTDHNRIKFIHFPLIDLDSFTNISTIGPMSHTVIEHHKPIIRELVASRFNKSDRIGALIVDMLCTTMIDVGQEFMVPSYVFFTSNAAFLGTMFHFQTLYDEHNQDVSELENASTELLIPSYKTPVPSTVLPLMVSDKNMWSNRVIHFTRGYRKSNGIIINTFQDLEPHALCSYDNKTPPIYAVGPMLKPEKPTPDNEVLQWLKSQPKQSVVLLCFGSRGWFNKEQVGEIATAIEKSGYRFVWSLRPPPNEDEKGFPGEYTDYNEVLPIGFLDRTAEKGKVVGWVPQAEVLADVAIGGFVSHCGWNSILESLWYGVPIATWPIYAEQQLNAHYMVKELGLAVEISLDYCQLNKNQSLVLADDIEKGIREVMDCESEVRAKVISMRTKSRMALEDGGSSSTGLQELYQNFM